MVWRGEDGEREWVGERRSRGDGISDKCVFGVVLGRGDGDI